MSNAPSRTAIIESLEAGVEELLDGEAWRNWLDFQSQFHGYSFGNCLLIRCQRPRATRVAGFHAWRRLGRSVRRGEKGIWILAPVTRRIADTAEEEACDVRSDRVLGGFKTVPVFDIEQTDGRPPPLLPAEQLRGEEPGRVFEQLVGVAREIGYVVEQNHLPRGRNGDCSYADRRIRIEVRNGGAQRVKTLTHELAHAMLHEDAANRPLAELEAESIAYVVCGAIGIDSGAYSFGYVASWAGGGDKAITGIRPAATRIQQTADRILESIQHASGPHDGRPLVDGIGLSRSTRRLRPRAGA